MTTQTSAFADAAATWDQRFATEDFIFGQQPNEYLRAQAALLRPGSRALCVADGEGRNSVWLARQGLQVDAFDISAVGVAKARRLAAAGRRDGRLRRRRWRRAGLAARSLRPGRGDLHPVRRPADARSPVRAHGRHIAPGRAAGAAGLPARTTGEQDRRPAARVAPVHRGDCCASRSPRWRSSNCAATTPNSPRARSTAAASALIGLVARKR